MYTNRYNCFFMILALTFCTITLPVYAGDSPGYRGADRNGIFSETGLMQEWPESGPALEWKTGSLGNGWSGPAVTEDAVYIASGVPGNLSCFSLEGELRWKVPYGQEYVQRWRGSRATPSVTDKTVIVSSGIGEIIAFDRKTGEQRWRIDTREAFGNQIPGWGYNVTPLLTEKGLIVPIRRGKHTYVLLDPDTGEVRWANPLLQDFAYGDASPIRVQNGNRTLIFDVYYSAVFATDLETGEVVWQQPNKNSTSFTPVYADGVIFAQGTQSGTQLFKPAGNGRDFTEVWAKKLPIDGLCQGLIHEGRLYGFGKTDFHEDGAPVTKQNPFSPTPNSKKIQKHALLVIDLADGEILHAHPASATGNVAFADGRIYWQTEGPEILLAVPTETGFDIVGRFTPEVGNGENWIQMVIARGRLFVRSDTSAGDYETRAGKLAVYNLKADQLPILRAQAQALENARRQLTESDPTARQNALKTIRDLGPRGRSAVSDVVNCLNDQAADVRSLAFETLATMGEDALAPIMVVRANGGAYADALDQALMKLTAAAGIAEAYIKAAETIPTAENRKAGMTLLTSLGKAAVPAIREKMPKSDKTFRWWLLDVCEAMGPAAIEALPDLFSMSEREDVWFQEKISRIYVKIGSPDAIPSLLSQLRRHDRKENLLAAINALKALNADSPEVTAAVKAVLEKDKLDDNVKKAAEAFLNLFPAEPVQ